MPLPIPRWVISSPSHITSAVPAVHVMTISSACHAVKSGMKLGALRASGCPDCRAGRRCRSSARTRTPVDCIERQRDGEVTRPLRDLLLPGLAFVLPFLELRDHDPEQLHDDRRRDVRHDPEEEHRDVGERAAGEQVEEPDDAAAPFACFCSSWIALKSTYGTGMCDPSRKITMMKSVKRILFRRSATRNMFARRLKPSMRARRPPEADGETRQCSYRLACCVPSGGRTAIAPRQRDHLGGSAGGLDGPDRGGREAVRRTVSVLVSSPRASTLTRPRLATRPCARSVSGVTSAPASKLVEQSRGSRRGTRPGTGC